MRARFNASSSRAPPIEAAVFEYVDIRIKLRRLLPVSRFIDRTHSIIRTLLNGFTDGACRPKHRPYCIRFGRRPIAEYRQTLRVAKALLHDGICQQSIMPHTRRRNILLNIDSERARQRNVITTAMVASNLSISRTGGNMLKILDMASCRIFEITRKLFKINLPVGS